MTKRKTAEANQALTLEQRRRFLKLPIEQRRGQMAKQAARMRAPLSFESALSARELWQGGDLVEPN